MLDLLVGARAVHFASTVVVAGAAIFPAAIAGDASREHGASLSAAQRQLDSLMLFALGIAVVSGAFWLFLFSSQLERILAADMDSSSIYWSVLIGTQFGRISVMRVLVAVPLAVLAFFRYSRPCDTPPILIWLIAALGLAFVVSLAWCGHAGGGIGFSGDVHLGADVIHLGTAAAWVGGLVPLLIFVRPSLPLTSIERYQMVRRFSTLAAWSVTLLAASGFANAWFMTDGLQHLLGTEYGNLVLVKVGLFFAMLGFAGLNRFWLTPRLMDGNALRLLYFSTATEIVLGFVVICVVAVLGQLEPAGHLHASALG
jgi:putative copper resistance protein D